MSPATNIEPVEAKGGAGRAIAVRMGIAAVGVGIAVAAFLATLSWMRAHHASFGLILVATAVYGVAVVGVAWGGVRAGTPRRRRRLPHGGAPALPEAHDDRLARLRSVAGGGHRGSTATCRTDRR